MAVDGTRPQPHAGKAERRRPGRRSYDDRLGDIARALRVVDDPDALGQLHLAGDPLIVALAEHRYGRVTRLSRGCALRDLLKACLTHVAEDSKAPLADFARAYAEQTPIARIARQLGLSRAHLSRVYRPRLVALVADEMSVELLRDGTASASMRLAEKSQA